MQQVEARSGRMTARKLDHLRVSKGENGGYSVEHHYVEGGMTYHKPSAHNFGPDEGDAMLMHVGKHMGVEPPQGEGGGNAEKA